MTADQFTATVHGMNNATSSRFTGYIARLKADDGHAVACSALADSERKRASDYMMRRRKQDPLFRLVQDMRSRTHTALKGKGRSKRTMALVGCSIHELKAHIEKQFLPGMTWANRSKWHVDHIRPCASFDLFDPAQQAACFHFSNLQPLWAADNIRKSDKWTPPEQCR